MATEPEPRRPADPGRATAAVRAARWRPWLPALALALAGLAGLGGCASLAPPPAPPVTAETPLLPVDLRRVDDTALNPVFSDARRHAFSDRQPVAPPDESALRQVCFLHDADYTARTLRMSPADREAVAAAYGRASALAAARVQLANDRFRLDHQQRFLDDAAISRLAKVNPRRPPGPLGRLDEGFLSMWPEHRAARRALTHNRAVLDARTQEQAAALQAFASALSGAHTRMLQAWAQLPPGAVALDTLAELEVYRQNHLRECVRRVAADTPLPPLEPPEAQETLAAWVRAQVASQRAGLVASIRQSARRFELNELMQRLNRAPLLRAALGADPEVASALRAAQQRFDVAEEKERAAQAQARLAEQKQQERREREEALARVRTNPAPTASQLQEFLAQAHYDSQRRQGNSGLERAGHGAYSVTRAAPLVGNVRVEVRFETEQVQCTRQGGSHRCEVDFAVTTHANLPTLMSVMGVQPRDRDRLSAAFRWTEAGLVSPEATAWVDQRVARLIAGHNARVERDRERQNCIDRNFRQRGTEGYSSARRRAEAACR